MCDGGQDGEPGRVTTVIGRGTVNQAEDRIAIFKSVAKAFQDNYTGTLTAPPSIPGSIRQSCIVRRG